MTIDSFFSEIPTLTTENYVLRGLTLDDTQSIYSFMSDPVTMQYITPHPVQTEEELSAVLEKYLQDYQERKGIPWVIINKFNHEVIGVFRFHKLHLWHKKAEMGVVIHKDYQHRGVMTEVLKDILDFGFNQLGLNRIVGDIFAENIGSKKLLMKYGFKKEGQLRQTDFDGEQFHDTVVYSLLQSEYRSKC